MSLNIENSKRLMFGNILCISNDDFETLIVATIFGRDKLQNQLIAVKLETEPFQLKRNQNYTVIESKAYFVSYMHALKALQEIREVPLKKYIVEVEETYTSPDYLSRLSSYKQRRVIRNNNIKHIENLEFKVLDSIDNWPSAAMLRLDESQRQALYGALTRKMAIIQGPPGTGKTHLGLLITRILLENKENWNFQSSHPLLVVCVTNHALDQFLEGMLKFTNKICRVGSRSQNEALEEYQINKLMFNSRDINLVNDRYNVLKSGLKEMHELGIVIPACFTPLIGVSMRNFLTINYDDNTISKNNKSDDKKEESKNADSNDTNDADDEIMKEERNRMLVESDDEEEIQIESLHYEIVGLTKLPELQFDSTPTDIAETINKFESHIKRKPFDINNKVYAIQIEMLKREERVIKAGESVTFTKDEIRDIEAKADVNLDFISRWKLYKYWKCKLSKIYQRKLSSLERSHLKLSKSMTSLKDLKYLNVMKNVDVVGMTTTGAAHYCKVLHDLAPPIVIVEEAAEILEAHIVASLSESCQHLILIGDHQQLRPKPEVYELSLHYQMDTSFFERMIRNGVLYHTLEYQHRMRPAISNLLVPTVYPNLKDHRAVFSYPHIRGVKRDLFFVDHNVYERDNNFEETESFQNPYEAEFLMGLCRYLIYQGYGDSDITIITPYFGQYRYLKQLQKKSEFQNCSEIRISVLDNYQGEESNIILLSLVRSNEERRVGFVKVDNRITVALSRAKHGMFIIGNMSQMAESSSLWREIQNKLISGGNIGSKMKLVCSNHPNEIMEVRSLEDFNKKTPKGGCSIPCTEILPGCGHRCPSLCHIIDKDHLQTKCTHRCAKKLCELGHQCPKLCYQKCDKCIAPVEKLLPCGHVHPVECSTDPKLFKCSTKVRRQLPSCKHIFDLECHVDISTYKCPMKCGTLLPCGNPCILTCHPMHEGFGISNLEKIPLNCDCSHKCINKCHEPLGSFSV
ncbi:NFX1-type zinc finger-containing protein 1 [Armadillidium vulgare]|nr:NFX1-type zinc finger-containing protein 1 [Armadillidium vulgare]